MREHPASLQYGFRKTSTPVETGLASSPAANGDAASCVSTEILGGIVRKYLGVLAGIAALCAMSWAQAPPAPAPAPAQAPTPAQTPAPEPADIAAPTAKTPPPAPQYPRFELFAGGSYAEAGLFNAGHWAGLPGWDASLGLNATHWLGFIVEGGQFFGTSKIPGAVPAPFPTNLGPFCNTAGCTFNVTTREYNVLFGVQFARRKYERWTPIGELLFGHQGTRGVATPLSGSRITEVGTGRALVAGGGADFKINQRFALRFKADYLQTGTAFPLQPKQKQDNFRFSLGVVIRSVHKKKRRLEDETQPEP
jgi:hypothetical protein